jgi:hypothetical protein
MSRSGYSTDCDDFSLICWRGAVAKVIRGKRGQAFLLEMWKAITALPEPKLIANELVEKDGAVCAMGAVGKQRGLDMSALDPEDPQGVAGAFGINEKLAMEIAYMNDEGGFHETPEERHARMKRWIEVNLKPVDIVEIEEPSTPTDQK